MKRVKSLTDLRSEDEKQQGFDQFIELVSRKLDKGQSKLPGSRKHSITDIIKKKRVSIALPNERMAIVSESDE